MAAHLPPSSRIAQGLGEGRLFILPVELDESAKYAIQFTAAHLLREGDTVLLTHVVPAYSEQFQPALGFGGEAVLMPVRDTELEEEKVCAQRVMRCCVTQRAADEAVRATQRKEAEEFIITKLEPLLKGVEKASDAACAHNLDGAPLLLTCCARCLCNTSYWPSTPTPTRLVRSSPTRQRSWTLR